MIVSLADLRDYVREDLAAHAVRSPVSLLRLPQARWQVRLRVLEYLTNRRAGPLGSLVRNLVAWRVLVCGSRLGLTIPPNAFGPGLEIVHWGTIVVSGEARVGARCRIHPSTSIGVNHGKAPRIGDDCYLGPGARVFGDIELGDRVTVGANAVVNRSFADDSVVAGVPATVVRRARTV